MPHPEPVAPREKRRIGRYVVTARLGKGGMGMVYRGFDEALEREVALKTLTMEGTLEEESRKRFAIEAKAAARLQHPNIVTVFELGEDRGLPFIAMELLPGVDLDTLLRSGQPLFVEEALDIVAQVCRGLHFAHEHGIVHRDVKPSNIRLLEDGTAKIMDFGIAKLGASGVTKTGMMVGTIHYMSPEQVLGKALDGRSDVWSAGVILYELIAGRRPFQGEAATEVLYRIAHAEPPPLETDAAAEVPRAIELVSRALAKDTARRPTALEMADELASMASERIRAVAVPIPAEALETVNTSRRLLREGRVEEGVQRLRAVAEAHPHSLEARRLLRVATGEMWRRQNAAPAAPEDDFPELAITWQSPPTRVAGETVALPATVAAPPHGGAAHVTGAGAPSAPADRGGRTVLWAGAAFAAAAVLAGGILVATRRPPVAAPERPVVASRPATDPGGGTAAVPATGTAAAPPAASGPAVVPAAAPALPAPAPVVTGRVAVTSPYAVEVLFKGRVVGKANEGPFALPVGRHTVTLASARHFLRANIPVEVREDGLATINAPALGRISIKASPDNCEVFIDGAFVDYPPILDRAIAAGEHTVAFKWKDGIRAEYPVDVRAGAPAFVSGRKDDAR